MSRAKGVPGRSGPLGAEAGRSLSPVSNRTVPAGPSRSAPGGGVGFKADLADLANTQGQCLRLSAPSGSTFPGFKPRFLPRLWPLPSGSEGLLTGWLQGLKRRERLVQGAQSVGLVSSLTVYWVSASQSEASQRHRDGAFSGTGRRRRGQSLGSPRRKTQPFRGHLLLGLAQPSPPGNSHGWGWLKS